MERLFVGLFVLSLDGLVQVILRRHGLDGFGWAGSAVATLSAEFHEVASEAQRSGLPLVNFCSAFEVAAKKGHIEIQELPWRATLTWRIPNPQSLP
eukprot:Skav234697  [mRNA]  locus=scaffold3643:188151:190813:- [translate_table: standard]